MRLTPGPCTLCGRAFDADEWVRDRSKPTGYATTCKACHRARAAAGRARRPTSHLESDRRWWRANAPAKHEATARRRRAKRRKVGWADVPGMREIYALAAWLRSKGLAVDVDHAVPLKGRTVCGLHAACNLRLAFATENRRKGHRHWPDDLGLLAGQFAAVLLIWRDS